MIYIYYGSDYGQVINAVKLETDKINQAVNIIKYNGLNNYVQEVVEEASSFSLFDEKKIILFEYCYFLSTKKIKSLISEEKQNYKSLINYAKNNEGYDLICVVPGELDTKKEIVNVLKENGALIYQIKPFTKEEYIKYAQDIAKKRNKTISVDAIEEIYKRTLIKVDYKENTDFFHFKNELDKLLTFNNNITLKNVQTLVYKPLEDDIFQTVSSLLNKNINQAINSYYQLRQSSYEPLNLLPIFVSQFILLAQVRFNMDQRKSDNQIMDELKLSKGRLYYTKISSSTLSYLTFIKIINELGEIEKGIKLYQDDGDTSLMHFMVTFSNKFKN